MIDGRVTIDNGAGYNSQRWLPRPEMNDNYIKMMNNNQSCGPKG